MKLLLLAAALSVSGIALAQDTSPPADTAQPPADTSTPADTTAQPPADTSAPSGATTTDGTQPSDGVTQQGTDPSGQAVPPAGTNEPMNPPPGAVVVPNPNQSAAFTPQPATTEYPPCSKTVTDRCVQTYERGVARKRRGR